MGVSQLTAGHAGSDFVIGVQSDLDSLRFLLPGWDGYGAPAVDSSVIEAAKSFIAALPADVAPRPRVVPMSNATLQLEWHRGPKSLELEFESPTSIRYLKWFPEEGIEQEASIPAARIDVLAGLLLWFVNGIPE